MIRFLLFQPTRPLRGATIAPRTASTSLLFQPTRPLRGATLRLTTFRHGKKDFNPRAPCGARLHDVADDPSPFSISTHAPLAGRDASLVYLLTRLKRISTHAPLAGRDRLTPYRSCIAMISTHAPLAGRDKCLGSSHGMTKISTHAPLAGRDRRFPRSWTMRSKNFNPRAPCGARLVLVPLQGSTQSISTHAPLAGRDDA